MLARGLFQLSIIMANPVKTYEVIKEGVWFDGFIPVGETVTITARAATTYLHFGQLKEVEPQGDDKGDDKGDADKQPKGEDKTPEKGNKGSK